MANDEAPWLQRYWWVISITAVIVAIGYSAAWFMTAALMKLQTAQFLAAQRSAGIIVNTGPIESSGFPGRVHVTISDVAVAAPIVGGGWTWQTKRVRVAAWPLVWHKLDLDLGGTHRLAGMVMQVTANANYAPPALYVA